MGRGERRARQASVTRQNEQNKQNGFWEVRKETTNMKTILKTLICTPLLTSIMITLVLSTSATASAATFVETASEPFGRFGGIQYIRYTGRFVGTTALGAYRMAFEIVAPAD